VSSSESKIYRSVSWLFLVNALVNWSVSLPGLINPAAAAAAFGGVEPNYPSLIRLWQGFVFMFGCMFWEVSRNVPGRAALIKYNWIEKSITATAITSGYFTGDIPSRLMLLIILTNWIWIPFIVWGDVAVRKAMRSEA
jgi:hypothetical protein